MTCLSSGFHFTALCLRLSYPVSRHFPPSAVVAPFTHTYVDIYRPRLARHVEVSSGLYSAAGWSVLTYRRLICIISDGIFDIQRANCYARMIMSEMFFISILMKAIGPQVCKQEKCLYFKNLIYCFSAPFKSTRGESLSQIFHLRENIFLI